MADFQERRTIMVDTQVRPSDVTKFPIIDAMLSIPREDFVPADQRDAAYLGDHLPLGPGRVVLDARTFAKVLEALDVQPDETVLDVGCGLGYSTAVLARMADFVVGLEDDADRADEAQSALSAKGMDNAVVVQGDLAEGVAKSGPYDVIILQGAVETLPDALLDQLRDGGRIACIFATGALGTVKIGYKLDSQVTWRDSFNGSAPVLPGFEAPREFIL